MSIRIAGLAAAAAAFALTACTAAQKQDVQRGADDALIGAQVRAKMAAVDPATLSLVRVAVTQGRVRLNGEVPSDGERVKVEEAARSVSGVRRVIDELRVNAKAPTGTEIARDLALEARVKAAIARDAGVNAFRLRVSAHKGVVELQGSVPTSALRAVVLESAKGVPGVDRIVANISVAK